MKIDQVHFYVEDASTWRDWFVHKLGFQSAASHKSDYTHTEAVQSGALCFLLSAARSPQSSVYQYLQHHPPGIADLTFRVVNLDQAIARASQAGARVVRSPQCLTDSQALTDSQGTLRLAQIQGWGNLRHTLVERPEGSSLAIAVEGEEPKLFTSELQAQAALTQVDHAVLNVEAGDLEQALAWYEAVLGFRRQQAFEIHTERSALCSRVLTHPQGTAQLPINEPASSGSQIQEFLDHNRGPGIQHLALQTPEIIQTIAQLRQQGVAFLTVPFSYYEQLRLRPGFQLTEAEWQAIAHQEVLADWQAETPQGLLLQAFTHPIFAQPTFFFELIERRQYWFNQQQQQARGFGEGNFRALFEAIEREQIKRGSLT